MKLLARINGRLYRPIAGLWNASAQTQAKRLILKDGSYQLAAKYEIKGDRVRYYSAERGEWEEIPKNLIDWDATENMNKAACKARHLRKQSNSTRNLKPSKKPKKRALPASRPACVCRRWRRFPARHISKSAPTRRTPAVRRRAESKHKKEHLARRHQSARQRQANHRTGRRARQDSIHTGVPAIYVEHRSAGCDRCPRHHERRAAAGAAAERFKIIRTEIKNGKRIAGAIKIAPYGKVKADERFVPATMQELTGGWIKISPKEPLASGEYAVGENAGQRRHEPFTSGTSA